MKQLAKAIVALSALLVVFVGPLAYLANIMGV